jgi:hypothetical protein
MEDLVDSCDGNLTAVFRIINNFDEIKALEIDLS